MAEVTRKSVLALMTEVTRGTPVMPTAGSDFTAIQEDVDLTPAFDELENAELSGSIGQKQTVLGIERPEMSFSHYMRHSGVEGQAPDYNLLLESLFGAEDVASTEYNTIAASTAGTAAARAIVKVDSGEGANFRRGSALLIKDATNGYKVRNIYSISTDDLTVAFNMDDAPGTGVNLGKCVSYYPAADDSDYPSLSAWMYRGNGGAVELMSGGRTTSMTMDVTAGEQINGSFTVAGLEYSFNPITITATNKYIDFTDDGGTTVAVLTPGTYKDPNELAAHIQTVGQAAATASGGDDFLCTYSSTTGKFTISTTTGTLLSILWLTGTNNANGAHTALGFTKADDTGATSYTSDSALSWAASYTPSYDSENPVVAKGIEAMWGAFDEYLCKEASSISLSYTNEVSDVNSICSTSGRSDTVFNGRSVTVDAVLLLERHEVDTFSRFREGTNVPFALTFGRKSGGNWVAGSVGNIYLPDATITNFKVADQDGLAVLNISFRAFVGSGQTEEVFLNFL